MAAAPKILKSEGQSEVITSGLTKPLAIPKKILISSASELPNEYSTTPGGTMFSTTPGGSKIIYERAFLLNLRNSPLAKTPPKNLRKIPGVTKKTESLESKKENVEAVENETEVENVKDDQFDMEL